MADVYDTPPLERLLPLLDTVSVASSAASRPSLAALQLQPSGAVLSGSFCVGGRLLEAPAPKARICCAARLEHCQRQHESPCCPSAP